MPTSADKAEQQNIVAVVKKANSECVTRDYLILLFYKLLIRGYVPLESADWHSLTPLFLW